MLLYLFFLLNFGINALPTNSNISHPVNRRLKLKNGAINRLGNISSILSNIKVPKGFNLTEVVKDLKSFGIEHLKDDKHLEALPLDRDGKVNPDFHKEIFLGNHELFEADIQNDKQKRDQKLEEIFNQADQDHDKRLSKEELLNHVFKNVQLHLKEAKDKNSQLFVLIDTNQNGKVTWQEYSSLYVKFHKLNSTSIKNFDDVDFIQESFDDKLTQELLKIRHRWTQADQDFDNELNIDEFLEFRHPEIAGRSYKSIVDDLILQTDMDGNEKLNKSEFIFRPVHSLDYEIKDKNWIEANKRWLEQQQTEFHEMDENNDGLLTRDELLKGYDPMNRVHINIQIKKLFSKTDDSPKDDYLSLSEIQKHADVFTGMHIVDPTDELHQEM